MFSQTAFAGRLMCSDWAFEVPCIVCQQTGNNYKKSVTWVCYDRASLYDPIVSCSDCNSSSCKISSFLCRHLVTNLTGKFFDIFLLIVSRLRLCCKLCFHVLQVNKSPYFIKLGTWMPMSPGAYGQRFFVQIQNGGPWCSD